MEIPRTTRSIWPLILATLAAPILAAPPARDLDGRIKSACDRGCNWLIDHQNKDGGYGPQQDGHSTVGVTALVVTALARSPRAYREVDGPYISDAVRFLLEHRQEDGGIYDSGLWTYSTAMAILALTSVDRKKHEAVIAKARDFIVKGQLCEESEPPYRKDEHVMYGGLGYGSSRRADNSNTQLGVEAVSEAGGLPKDHPFYKRTIVFVSRCQNFCDGNDAIASGMLPDVASTEDGGMIYYPGYSSAGFTKTQEGKLAYTSYGSMTYSGIKSFIYAGLSRDDKRVRAAYDWIRANYTLDENPGMAKGDPKNAEDGLFYNYLVMSKALSLIGDPRIVTADGKKHPWADELAEKLISLQKPDGTWVNENPRWWESVPEVSTPYSILALTTCAAVRKTIPEETTGAAAKEREGK
ncbi:MAG: terpene cyclase/mutase family protein [Planctomycetes bacterium]|nr:terpene cyclase/mutase family protein [Planctomycetota bacterium]